MKIQDFFSSNQIYALLAKGIEGCKVILVNIFLARLLGAEVYGKYAYIIGICSLLAIVAEFRLQAILVKEFLLYGAKNQGDILGTALGVNIAFGLLGIFLSFLYYLYEPDSLIGYAVLLCSLSYIFNVPRCFRALYISQERNIFIAKSEFFSSIVTIFIIVMALKYSIDWVFLPVLRLTDGLFLSLAFCMFYVCFLKKAKLVYSFSFYRAKTLVSSASPLVLSGVAMLLFQRMDLIMIRYYMDESAVGIYSVAANYMLLFSLIPMVLSESLAPKIFKGQFNLQQKRQFILRVMALGFLMSLLMYITGENLITLIYGEAYTESIQVSSILAFCPFLVAAGSAAGQLIVFDSSQRKAFWKSVWACVINFALNILLIPSWGIVGAAVATVLGFFVANFLGHWFVKEYKYIFFSQISFFAPSKIRNIF